MDRRPPSTTSDEIDLYIRTYYSLLRSSGDVWVRAFEEAHTYSDSSLHAGARSEEPDVAAFAYSAGRLPECFPWVERVVLGQSFEQFEAVGMPARTWQEVRARGRRRAMRWDGRSTLAVFVTSASDVDDLIPILTAYQIEWNKLHGRLLGDRDLTDLGLTDVQVARLLGALGQGHIAAFEQIRHRPSDLAIRLLSSSFAEYQTTGHRWWSGIEPRYLIGGKRRPVYFVSSNTHALINLASGYARSRRDEIVEFARRVDPDGISAELEAALRAGDEGALANYLYFVLRAYLRHDEAASVDERIAAVQAFDAESGVQTIASPGRIDVAAQLIEVSKLMPERFDPRITMPGLDRLAASDAVILNIDYPLGMAAYHHLARVAQGSGEVRGIYVMGKAATLNGRVGDVLMSHAVYDEHSKNTYLFSNAFAARDVQPYMKRGTVLDNQKAVTVRSAYLQNRRYMSVLYDEGYTVLEMESGPYLSAVYEMVNPERHPDDEIVNLTANVGFEVGILHYASDTPYSRRQTLLSKSMSFFGMEATYACTIAILRRIFTREIERIAAHGARQTWTMAGPAYLDQALAQLGRDRALGDLIARHGPPRLRRTRNPFESLTRAIVYQQLAGAAAATIHGRFVALFGRHTTYPTPAQVLATPLARLKSAGLSRQKASYVLDLAAHFADGRVPVKRLGRMSDAQVIEALLPIKGVGRWTVDMFLLFGLNRPDVLPTGDFGVMHGMKVFFRLRQPPKPTRMIELAAPWAPFRSIGSWYMWRAYEDARAG